MGAGCSGTREVQDDPVEKVEFGLGLKRGDGFGKATKKRHSRPGSIPWRQKGWEVNVSVCGAPATSQLLLWVTHVISATHGWRPEPPQLRGEIWGAHSCNRVNSCPSEGGEGYLEWGLGGGAH